MLSTSIEEMFINCARAAVGGKERLHFDDGRASLCGLVAWTFTSGQYGVSASTTQVTRVTCRECCTKLINAIQAMPFLNSEGE